MTTTVYVMDTENLAINVIKKNVRHGANTIKNRMKRKTATKCAMVIKSMETIVTQTNAHHGA